MRCQLFVILIGEFQGSHHHVPSSPPLLSTLFSFSSITSSNPNLLKQVRLLRPAPAARLVAYRFLSQEVRSTIQKAVTSSPVVLFMKGTPELPECGFSRAVIQVLDLHGVPPEKMQTYNVLADAELRSGIKEFSCVLIPLFFTSTHARCVENGQPSHSCTLMASSSVAVISS